MVQVWGCKEMSLEDPNVVGQSYILDVLQLSLILTPVLVLKMVVWMSIKKEWMIIR